MDYDQLITFVKLAETGSFSHTAEKLNLTQPAVSKRIALLESQLNCVLFDRIGKQNKLTAAGELALLRVNRIISESKELKNDIENLSTRISGHLIISTSHHIGLHRLPGILKQYVKQYPEVELDMRFRDSEIAFDDVLHGRSALAIATLPAEITDNHISAYPLWLDKLSLVCAANHPLTRVKTLQLKDLEAYNAILPGDETFTRRIINKYFNSNELKLKIAFETNYLETIKVMVASGLGWSVLPEILADGDLHLFALKSLKLTRMLGAIVNTQMTSTNSSMAMINLLKQMSQYRKLN